MRTNPGAFNSALGNAWSDSHKACKANLSRPGSEAPSWRPSWEEQRREPPKGDEMKKALFLLSAAVISVESAAASYPTRCDELRGLLGGNLVACWDFENPEDALLREPGHPGAEYRPAVKIDPNVAASGNSSLRFETISFNEAKRRHPEMTDEQALTVARQSNTSWWGRNFSPDWSIQFGLGQEFWIQMRMRENNAFYAGPWGGGGPKKWILGTGDRWVDFRSTLREPLPATAGRGALIKLSGGDPVLQMPKGGKIRIGNEYIQYWGKDAAQNALKVFHRGADETMVQNHAAGTGTHLHHAQYAGGCTDLELPVTQTWNFIPASYHSCKWKDWSYEGHYLPLRFDFILQSGQRGKWSEANQAWEGGCLHSRVKAGDMSGCLRDGPGQGWVTWTIQVKLGQRRWYANDERYTHASTIRIWRNDKLMTDLSPENRHPRVGAPTPEECAASDRSIVNALDCLTGYDLVRAPEGSTVNAGKSGPLSASDAAAGAGKYGQIFLNLQSWKRQYLTADDPIMCCHPTVIRWYDDLVVSRAPIPLPDGRMPPLPAP